jgi:uncharacterized membrane protein YphA (DoxX/SURF4 family)
MKSTIARILFALPMVLFGLNKFLQFIPSPELNESAGELIGIYKESGFLYLIGALELLGGICLLINKFVPLVLITLIAIMLNAVVFWLLHDHSGIVPPTVILVIGLFNVYFVRDRFTSLLSA